MTDTPRPSSQHLQHSQLSSGAPIVEGTQLPPSLESLVDSIHAYSEAEVLSPLTDASPALQSEAINLPQLSDISETAFACVAQMKPLQECLETDTSTFLPHAALTLDTVQAQLEVYVHAQQQALDGVTDTIAAMNSHVRSAVHLFNYMRHNQDQPKKDAAWLVELARGLDIPDLASLQPYQAYERIGQRWKRLERDCIAAQLVWLRAMMNNTRLTFFLAVGSCVAANAQWLRDDGLQETGFDWEGDQAWSQMFGAIRAQPFRTEWPRSWGEVSGEGVQDYFIQNK